MLDRTSFHHHLMTRPRLIRGLRIAWSVWWGILCVLLIGLWVRSYWWCDSYTYVTDSYRVIRPVSACGDVTMGYRLLNSEDSLGLLSTSVGDGWTKSSFRRFYLYTYEDHVWMTIPYWAFAAFAVGLGGVPWLPWKYSLRTLLIATTAIAVILGLVVYATR